MGTDRPPGATGGSSSRGSASDCLLNERLPPAEPPELLPRLVRDSATAIIRDRSLRAWPLRTLIWHPYTGHSHLIVEG